MIKNNMADLHNVFISHYGEDEKQLDSLKQNLKNHGCDARNSSVEKKDYDNERYIVNSIMVIGWSRMSLAFSPK